jgi:peptidyl-dipeptidase Dcp
MIRLLALGVGVAALLAAPAVPASAAEANVNDPLLAPWTGPHGGVPPFDQVKVERFEPALEAAMAEQLREVDAIANDPAPPPSRTRWPRSSARAAPSTAW